MTENKSVEWPYLLPSNPQMSEKELREQAERIWETHKEVFFRLSFTQASMVARALLTATGHTARQTDFVQFLIDAKLRENVRPADTPPRKVGRARLFKTEDDQEG